MNCDTVDTSTVATMEYFGSTLRSGEDFSETC